LDSVEVESGAYISVARISLDDLYQRARRYRTALIPRAEQAHAARLESYKTGRGNFSALLEGIRELSEMRREYQEILGEMQVRKARLESATGRALD
jgi:cell division septum initiation protein DivIVA